jgi:hypothetical protein
MKLYAIRHEETMANFKGIYNGILKEDINKTRIKQVELFLISYILLGIIH